MASGSASPIDPKEHHSETTLLDYFASQTKSHDELLPSQRMVDKAFAKLRETTNIQEAAIKALKKDMNNPSMP